MANELGNWNANVFPIQGRKCLIIMNDISFYCLLFLDVLKKDLIDFNELFGNRLTEQLDYDGIVLSGKCREAIMNNIECRFLPTNNNRKVLGTMNEFVYEIEYNLHRNYYGQLKLVNLPKLNSILTRYLIGALSPKRSEFGRPIEEMSIMLEKFCS